MAMADGCKFLAVRRLSQRSTGRKTQFLPTPYAFGTPMGVIPSKFRRDLLHHETGISKHRKQPKTT